MKIKTVLLITEAWCLLGIARMLLLLYPFKKIITMLGGQVSVQAPSTAAARIGNEQEQIRRAIRIACRCAPWRTKCFEQALAGKIMLRKRNISSTVYFGIDKENGQLIAHAWLQSEGLSITGGTQHNRYTVIGCFQN